MRVYLETERLVLRRFTEADLENLVELDGDPEVMRYLSGGPATSRDEVERAIMPLILGYYAQGDGFGFWAAIEKSTGEFLGWFSFRPHEEPDADTVGLGYRLRRIAWGKGYATEGARALIRKGFTELGVRRVVANTYEYNAGSRRVMEKAGLTFSRRYRLDPDDATTGDTFHSDSQEIWDGDEVEYALTQEGWEQQEAARMPQPGLQQA